MKTVIIKENSKQAKAVIEMLKTMPFVEIIENTGLSKPRTKKEENYNPQFVSEVKRRMKNEKFSAIKTK